MLRSQLEIPTGPYQRIRHHLFTEDVHSESAAFVLIDVTIDAEHLHMKAVDHYLVTPTEFEQQGYAYLELRDETFQRMIKQAHDKKAALLEIHSHPYDSENAACFSLSDRRGFAETVPHVMWRLPERPYAALVFSPKAFDGLVWVTDPNKPQHLDSMLVGKETLIPTKRTLKWWEAYDGSL